MQRARVAALILLAVFACGYTGSGGVWVHKKGDFTSTNKDGTRAGIQLAADYEVGGGLAQVSAGRYSFDQTVVLAKSGVTFNGSGDSTVFENTSAGGDTMMLVTGSNVTLRNLSFDGRRYAQTTGMGIVVTGKNVTIEKCSFQHFPTTAVLATSAATGLKVVGCTFKDVVNPLAQTYGVKVQADSADVIQNNFSGVFGYSRSTSQSVDSASASICFSGGRSVRALENRISWSGGAGVYFTGVTGGSASLNEISHQYAPYPYLWAGITADSLCNKITISDNRIVDQSTSAGQTGSGIDLEADSSQANYNYIAGTCFGIHVHQTGPHTEVSNNTIIGTGGQGLYLEFYPGGAWENVTRFNRLINCGQAIHYEANTVTFVYGNMVLEDNYIFGAKDTTKSAIRCLLVGGSWTTCSISRNHIWYPAHSGIEFIHTSGTGSWTKFVVQDNDVWYPSRYAVEFEPLSTNTGEAFVSGNMLVGGPAWAGETNMASATNWTFTGVAKETIRPTMVAVEDSARVNKTLEVSGELWRANNSWTKVRDSGGTLRPIMRVDSVNTVVLQPITSSNVDIYHTDGTLATRLYGTGGISVTHGGVYQLGGTTTLSNGGNDTRLHSRSAAGSVVFRDAANATDIFTVADGGSARVLHKLTVADSVVVDSAGLVGKIRAGGNIETSGGHLVTKTTIDMRNTASNSANPAIFRQAGTDALEFRSPGSSGQGFYFNNFGGTSTYAAAIPGGGGGKLWSGGAVVSVDSVDAGGPLIARGKATVYDSLNVIGVITAGEKSGIPQRHIFGSGGASSADTVTVQLNGGGVTEYSPKLELKRNTNPEFTLSTNGSNTYFRWETGDYLKGALLGSNTPFFVINSTGQAQFGGTSNPSHTLDVTGQAVVRDSLRANLGIMVGGPMIQAVYSATATLDFPSGTTDDLTISVGGAAVGDPVIVGAPNGSVSTTASFSGWVSSTGTVTIRCKRAATEDPASGTFRATVLHY